MILDGLVAKRASVKRGLLVAIGLLLALDLLAILTAPLWRDLDDGSLRTYVGSWFVLDSEQGLGTWFAVLQLALAASICALIGLRLRDRSEPWRGWLFTSILLAWMSIDEQIGAHEILGIVADRIGVSVKGSGLWFVLAFGLVLVVGAALIPFARSLTRRTRLGLFGACALFLIGALGFEALAWIYVIAWYGSPTGIGAGLLQLGEEGFELLAVALVVTTVLGYAATVSHRSELSSPGRSGYAI